MTDSKSFWTRNESGLIEGLPPLHCSFIFAFDSVLCVCVQHCSVAEKYLEMLAVVVWFEALDLLV